MRDDILKHYLNRFDKKLRTRPLAKRRGVGMEAKFCVADQKGKAVDGERLQELFQGLEHKGWTLSMDSNLDIATGAEKDGFSCPACISTGTGHCKVELSVPYGKTLRDLESNFVSMSRDVKSCAGEQGIKLLCLGVHPVIEPHPSLVQKKSRHIFWDEVFDTGLVHLFALSADCQVHVDVEPQEAHKAVNVFQGLAGAQIALTANATIWKDKVDYEYLDLKEAFWDWWLPGKERAGVVSTPFTSLEDYAHRLSSLRPVFVEREGHSLGIYDYPSFRDYYFKADKVYGVTAEGERVPIEAEEKDIDLHDTFNWYAARLSRYCTLENRANCQQPREDIMAVPALTLGLMENLESASSCIDEYDWNSLRGSRFQAMRSGLQTTVDGDPLSRLCRKMLDIAERGLASRGYGEEGYLKALWERLEGEICPAVETREAFLKGGLKNLLERYSL
jgi:gamma-glutamylcysteine synthetase